MTDIHPPLTAEPSSSFPHAHVLTYITGNNTAPHLRKIVFRGNLLLAALYFLSFGFAAWALTLELLHAFELSYYMPGPWVGPPPLKDRLLAILQEYYLPLFFTLLPLVCGLILVLCAGPASRGKRLAARTLIVASLPMLATLTVASALAFCGAISNFLDLHPSYTFICIALLLAFLLLLATLLLKDLLAYAAWARKNPIEEKPKSPFLPLRQRTA